MFYIGYIIVQFFINLFDSVVVNCFVYIVQLCVIYCVFGNCCVQVVGLQGGYEFFQQWYVSVREQVVIIFSGIGNNYVYFIQMFMGDGVGDKWQFMQ